MKRTRKMKCKSKRGRFETRADAYEALRSFYRRNYGGVVSPNAEAYKCDDHYHWGHYRNRKV